MKTEDTATQCHLVQLVPVLGTIKLAAYLSDFLREIMLYYLNVLQLPVELLKNNFGLNKHLWV